MKFKKITFALLILLWSGLVFNAYAMTTNNGNINETIKTDSKYNNVTNIKTLVQKSGSHIIACATIIPRNNYTVKGRLYLQKYNNNYWTSVKSWSIKDSGFISLSKLYSGTSGKYRTKLCLDIEGEYIVLCSKWKNIY